MNSSIAFPLLLTLLAGLATGIGSAIAFFAHRTNVRFLSFSLGLSAGVMIYVSFVELFAESQTLLTAQWGATAGVSATVACFFGGILLIGVIDRLVPSFENPHEMHSVEEMNRRPHDRKLMRMGLMTALVIGIHNFPEGIATFMSAIDNPTLGIAIAAAPSTTFPKASPFRSRSTTPRAVAARPSCFRCRRVWPNRSARCWPMPCCCRSSRRRCWGVCSDSLRASWSSFRSTNCCPLPRSTVSTTSRSTAW